MKVLHMRRIPASHRKKLLDPAITGLIAFRMGRADDMQYHFVAYSILVAAEVISMVERHRGLKDDIQAAHRALNSVYDRRKQRTLDDVPWSATPEEIDALELGVKIFDALVKATPAKTITRAMNAIARKFDQIANESTESSE